MLIHAYTTIVSLLPPYIILKYLAHLHLTKRRPQNSIIQWLLTVMMFHFMLPWLRWQSPPQFWCVPSSSNIGRIPNGALPGLPPTKSTMAWLSGKSKGSHSMPSLLPRKTEAHHYGHYAFPNRLRSILPFTAQESSSKNNLSFEHSHVIHLFFSSCLSLLPSFLLSFHFLSFPRIFWGT